MTTANAIASTPPADKPFDEISPATASNYRASRWFFATSAIWMVVTVLYGLFCALALIAPDLFGDVEQFTFGRMRPVHTNLVLFGFLLPGLLGSALYIVPKVCRTELFAPQLPLIAVVLWNGMLVVLIGTLIHGMTQGREYAEMIWPIDVAILAVWALLGIAIFGTIATRKEKILFVSAWYIGGSVFWTFMMYFVGNVLWDPTGNIGGINDTILLWFYGHNVFGLVITPLAVASGYYIISHATREPIWSHTLSLLAFWMLLLVYTHTGAHHLLQAPVPQWIKVIAIVDSIALLVPVFAFLMNVWLPLKDRMPRIHENIGAKMVFVGTIWYAITCVQGPMQSLPAVQQLTHFNNWVVAHAHIALLGFGGFVTMGSVYYLLPMVSGRKIWSLRLAEVQYWLILVGLIGFFTVLTAGGLVQGQGWLNGEVQYRILPQIAPYLVTRAMLGMLVVTGACLFAVNVLMTMWYGEPVEKEVDEEVEEEATEPGVRPRGEVAA